MKHGKNWKSFAAGMLTMAMIVTLGIPALAAGNTQTLRDVMVGGVRIVVDGEEIHPTDAGGNPVSPMIYNGTTYLPVRAVANALGKAVYWDGPNYTVYLGEMGGELEYPTVMLKDMTSINQSPSAVTTTYLLTDNYGNKYTSAYLNWYGHTSFEYLLNMKYSRFKGTVYVPQGQTGNNTCHITIQTDGHTVYTSPEIDKTSAPISIDVDITGCNDFKISFSHSNTGSDDITVCLAGDAGFYQ